MDAQRELQLKPRPESARHADWIAAKALIREMQAKTTPALRFINAFLSLFEVFCEYEAVLIEQPDTPSERDVGFHKELLMLLRGFALRAETFLPEVKAEHWELVGIRREEIEAIIADVNYREALYYRTQTKERSEKIIASLNG